MVIWRDLRYDFNFSSDMRTAELARRTQEVKETVLQTSVVYQTSLVTETAQSPKEDAIPEKASAAFVILTRNKDLKDLRETLVQLEDRFNRRYHYPY
ncbi:hypothetical protein LPJ57_006853, partial [Coemansia sp. RSA 486]